MRAKQSVVRNSIYGFKVVLLAVILRDFVKNTQSNRDVTACLLTASRQRKRGVENSSECGSAYRTVLTV